MTYPKTWLTRPARRGIMLTLIAAFFVISPSILLYTAGYRYDWTTARLTQTGAISVDIAPKDATVIVNQTRFVKRLPLELRYLTPGRYSLRIERAGYKPWEKEITVESKKTTYIKHIQLFSESLPIAILSSSSSLPSAAIASPDGTSLVLIESNPPIYQLTLFSPSTDTATPLMRTVATEPPMVRWSSSARSWIYIALQHAHERTVTLLRADAPQKMYTHAMQTSESIPMQWRTKNPQTVVIEDNRKLMLLDGEHEKLLTTLATGTPWFIDADDTIWNVSTSVHAIVAVNRHAEPVLYPSEHSITAIIHVNKERILAQTDAGFLILPRGTNEAQPQALQTVSSTWNQFTGKWLAWSPWEIWEIDSAGAAHLLERTSSRLTQVLPLDRFGELLLVYPHALTAFNVGYLVTHALHAGEGSTVIGIDYDRRIIYFTGTVALKSGLYQLSY